MSPSIDEAPRAPKIAIKGFSLKASSTTKPTTKPIPPSTLGKRPRTNFAHDSESEDESERKNGRHEVVTGFANGGVIRKEDRSEVKTPLVIPRMGNRDWRGNKKGKNLLPAEVQAERAAKAEGGKKMEGVDVVNSQDDQIQWGLSVRPRDAEKAKGSDIEKPSQTSPDVVVTETVEPNTNPLTADEEALARLTGQSTAPTGPALVIPTSTPNERLTEDAAYRAAIADAPEASTLEEYELVPVEEFGAAMLRGMGWKGEANASDIVRGKGEGIKRRQNLLGLGAKELKDAEELGAWVQKSDVKRLRPAGSDRRGGGEKKGMADYAREKREREERRRGRDDDDGYRGDRNGHRDRDGYRERERDRDGRRRFDDRERDRRR